MQDESVIFDILREELCSETGLLPHDIHQDSELIEDLDLSDEELETVLIALQDRLPGDLVLVGNNAVINCTTVYELMEIITDLLYDDDVSL